jgi:hypothetical protein
VFQCEVILVSKPGLTLYLGPAKPATKFAPEELKQWSGWLRAAAKFNRPPGTVKVDKHKPKEEPEPAVVTEREVVLEFTKMEPGTEAEWEEAFGLICQGETLLELLIEDPRTKPEVSAAQRELTSKFGVLAQKLHANKDVLAQFAAAAGLTGDFCARVVTGLVEGRW